MRLQCIYTIILVIDLLFKTHLRQQSKDIRSRSIGNSIILTHITASKNKQKIGLIFRFYRFYRSASFTIIILCFYVEVLKLIHNKFKTYTNIIGTQTCVSLVIIVFQIDIF